jgi:hypothetical protein
MATTTFLRKKLANYQSKKSFASKLRLKRFERMKQLIIDCYSKYGKVNIIDIGGTKIYWDLVANKKFLIENKCKISIINLPSGMKLPEDDEIFHYFEGDGCNLYNFSDKQFHIAHSNSVIEHVGDNINRKKFASEIKRVSEKFYIQTPNFWFPIEPHFVMLFFHWLPKAVRIKFVQYFELGWFPKAKDKIQAKEFVDKCNLLSKKTLKKLFPCATLYKERLFIVFIKSWILTGNSDENSCEHKY